MTWVPYGIQHPPSRPGQAERLHMLVMGVLRQGLSKDICGLVLGPEIHGLDGSPGNMVPDEVVAYVDMLDPLM